MMRKYLEAVGVALLSCFPGLVLAYVLGHVAWALTK